MLDLTRVKDEERRTALAVQRIQTDTWKYGSEPRTITVPQSFLLESLASLVTSPITMKRVGWRGNKTRLKGDPHAIKGVLHMYMSMVLGSDRIP